MINTRLSGKKYPQSKSGISQVSNRNITHRYGRSSVLSRRRKISLVFSWKKHRTRLAKKVTHVVSKRTRAIQRKAKVWGIEKMEEKTVS
jgi:hypothetical protein